MITFRTRPLTRQQIAEFVPSERGIRAFEAAQADLADQNDALGSGFLTVGDTDLAGARELAVAAGELTASDGGAGASYTLGLADTSIVAGAYGDAAHTLRVTVDAKGRAIGISTFVLSTTNIVEGSNLYFTNARARGAISGGTGIDYNSGTGVVAVAASGVTAGTYTSPSSITVDATGRITAITGGGGGGGGSDPFWASVVLLVGADSSVTDESLTPHTITTNSPAFRNTSSPKFGAGCMDPSNTGNFEIPMHGDFAIGSGDFTLEMWVKLGQDDQLWTCGSLSDRSWRLDVTSGKLRALLSTNGSSFTTIMSSGVATITDSVYHHVVFERAGTVLRTYVDGAMEQKATGYSSTVHTTADNPLIGDGLTGQIDELRITKGVARYDSDSGYTVPTAAFPRS